MNPRMHQAIRRAVFLPVCLFIVTVFGLVSCAQRNEDPNKSPADPPAVGTVDDHPSSDDPLRTDDSAVFSDENSTLLSGGSGVPEIFQFDDRWKETAYGTSTIGAAGCAPTCLAMVLSWILQDPSIMPDVISQWSEEQGLYVDGYGSSNLLLEAYPAAIGVQAEGIFRDPSAIASALASGQKLIANVGPGTFTSTGHFIVLADYQDGQIKVNDPNSAERSTWYPIETIVRESLYLWAYQ